MTAPTSRILSFIDAGYWAMLPSAFETMRAVVEARAGFGFPLSRAEKDAAIAQARAERPLASTSYSSPPAIAVLNIFGIISPRASMISDMSQEEGMACDMFCTRYRQVMSDPNIGGVIVNCDSPGGNVLQVEETADLVYSLRDAKPNVLVGTGLVASAALFIGLSFAEVVASPSSEWGSIGVLMRHMDLSRMADADGVTVTYITAPEGGYKSEGNPFEPLPDEAKDFYQSRCEEYYQAFIRSLARGRSAKAKTIDQEWGRGRTMGAMQAKSLGMVDRIGTLQMEIDRMAEKMMKGKKGRGGETGRRAEVGAEVGAGDRTPEIVGEAIPATAVELEAETEAPAPTVAIPPPSAPTSTDAAPPPPPAPDDAAHTRAKARLTLAGV